MEELFNHLKIYTKDGSQILMNGVATRDGFNDEAMTGGDKQTGH
jgi:hypothetical protein